MKKNTKNYIDGQKQYYCFSYAKSNFQLCREVQEKTLQIIIWQSPETVYPRMENSINIVQKTENYLQEYNHTVQSLECFEGKATTSRSYWLLFQHCRQQFEEET